MLLDLMLPEADGFELCRQIRESSSVAVIVVSARGGERDKVTALNMGADDYMTKPFSVEELMARITATLRRTRAAGAAEPGPRVITAGAVVIDLANQQVTRAGSPVHLTPTEFSLLRELVINRGKLLSHAHLLRRVWGPGVPDRNRVRACVRAAAAGQAGDRRRATADRHCPTSRLPVRRRVIVSGALFTALFMSSSDAILTVRSRGCLYRPLRFDDRDKRGRSTERTSGGGSATC